MAYAPPVTRHNYTNTHATHSNVPWSWTGLVPQCLVGLFASPRRCRWAALGCVGLGLRVPRPYGGGGEPPPPYGGAAYLRRARGRPPACRARALASARARASAASLYRILSRNLEFDPFSKSHSWAGYVCFVLLRECISVSVTYGDSCN